MVVRKVWQIVFLFGTLLIISTKFIYNIPRVLAVSYKQVTIPLKWDTYVESGFPNTLTYDQRNLFAGYDNNFNKKITYTYLMPDYASLKNLNISKDLILNAKLVLWAYYLPSNFIKFRLYIPKTLWDQYHLTFNTQPDLQYYTYKNLHIDSAGPIELNLTNAFLQDYSRFLNNNNTLGFAIKLSSNTDPAVRFWSSECLQAPEGLRCNSASQKPKIIITYKDNSIPVLGNIIAPSDRIKTNNKQIVFKFTKASDQDDDALYYRVIISKDSDFSNIYKTSSWQTWENLDKQNDDENIAQIVLSLGLDAKYYWRLEVKDQYDNKAVSQTRIITLDTTPPTIPSIIDEPPFTKGNKNTIYVLIPNYEQDELIEYQASPFYNFSDKVISSGWINSPNYTFTNLKPLKYYYRVRVKDALGNISNWSKIAWSIQDQSKPSIVYFKVTPNLLSKNDLLLSIKARFYDITLKQIGLLIYKNKKEIVNKAFSDQEYFSQKINIQGLDSGVYYVYAYGVDQFNNSSISNPKRVIIDKNPPLLKLWNLPKTNKLGFITTNKLSINISCKDSLTQTYLKIYVNNKKIYDSAPIPRYNFLLSDKKYTIKFICQDKALNKTEKILSFTVDTKKPEAPGLTIKNSGSVSRIVTAKCSEPGQVFFYFGKKLFIKQCKNGYANLTLKYLQTGKHYVVSAFEKDLAGNIGKTNSISFNIPHIHNKKVKQMTVNCYFSYDVNKHKYISKECKLQGNLHFSVTGQYKNGYIYYVKHNIPSKVNLLFTLRYCKPKSYFDLRTWFWCVPVEQTVIKTSGSILYGLDVKGSKLIKNNSRTGYLFKTPQKYLNIYVGGFLFSNSISKIDLLRYYWIFSRWNNIIKITRKVKAPYIPKPISYNKPFNWMFDEYHTITQWFGHTCWNTFHHGIDIAVYKEPIKVVADGRIVSMGYHYFSRKWAGGYWVGVKHYNGLYSYYWHLNGLQFTKSHGLKIGDYVRQGQYIAISGHSGYWQGHSLPYHLHFEVRKTRYQSSVLDPTLYLNVNWKKIPVCQGHCCTTGHDPRKRL